MQMKYIKNCTAKHLYHYDDSTEDSNFSFDRRIHLLKSILLHVHTREVKEIYKNSYLICGFHSKLPPITFGNE